ncbi:MAG TPA: 1-phosphofructokinase family hexose kinase [Anaerolineaceae bacterium]
MILCVNPNAAVDKTLVVNDFRLNAIHRPAVELALPGGKGCNVARVAKALGQQPVVAGWVGGHAGQFIEDGLHAEGIQTAFVQTAVESRDCISILDPSSGTMTEIYEKGRPVSPAELEAFETLFREWLPRVQLVTLSGSLPPGLPSHFYAGLIQLARAASVPAILDSSGEPLRAGLEEGRPEVLKCNRAELAGLTGQPLESLGDIRRVILELSNRLGATVVITLGATGAVATQGGRTWLAQAPQIQAVSAVGSGDAFLAGLACAMLAGKPLAEMLCLAVAAGSANALEIGAGRLHIEQVERLLEQVRIAEES